MSYSSFRRDPRKGEAPKTRAAVVTGVLFGSMLMILLFFPPCLVPDVWGWTVDYMFIGSCVFSIDYARWLTTLVTVALLGGIAVLMIMLSGRRSSSYLRGTAATSEFRGAFPAAGSVWCWYCGANNPEGARFCMACGNQLPEWAQRPRRTL